MSKPNSRIARWVIVLLGLLLACHLQAAVPRIAVVDFDSRQVKQLPGAQLADYVVDELVNQGGFDVIERARLKTIMEELHFGASGLVDSASAAKLGKILGATHLMTGQVISVEQETSQLKSNYGISGKNTAWSISISVRIYEVQTSKIVYSDRARARWVARDTPQYQSTSSAPFDRLAEAAAVEVVAGVQRAPFTQSVAAASTAAISVSIASVPVGADIEVDGIFIGNTDGSFQLTGGVHLVRISRAGLAPWEKKVNVVGGLKIQAVLE